MGLKLESGTVLDGYRLLEKIGEGGFGIVYRAQALALESEVAVKVVARERDRAQREIAAVKRFKELSHADNVDGLLPIEHVGVRDDFFFFVMPLADSLVDPQPDGVFGPPKTLAGLIARQKDQEDWFTPEEILAIMRPVGRAAAALAERGLVHRDIKPENILFYRGKACLSDLSLLTEDTLELTGSGTPGFQAPSWYLASGGHPDMYGFAATLYTLLTGYPPDRMGRAAFQLPPGAGDSFSAEWKKIWKNLHQLIFRATHEKASERFASLERLVACMEEIIAGVSTVDREQPNPLVPAKHLPYYGVAFVALLVAALVLDFPDLRSPDSRGNHPSQDSMALTGNPEGGADEAEEEEKSEELTSAQRADYLALMSMVAHYYSEREYQSTIESIDILLETYPIARRNPNLRTYRAASLVQLGKLEEAEQDLERGFDEPLNIPGLNLRVQLWTQLGRLDGAERDLNRVIEEWHPITIHYLMRAEVRFLAGNFAGVEEDLAIIHERYEKEGLDAERAVAGMREGFAERSPAYRKWLQQRQMTE